MSSSRTNTWITLTAVAIGLPLLIVAGVWLYMSTTATPLHPSPQDIPSLTHSAPPPDWTGAVEQARRVLRTNLVEQNLPGLSVAVGIKDRIVWAEGFGFADLENRTPVTPGHRFRIGTASVVLTSAAVGLLVEKGRLKLDDTIQTYVPSFPKKEWPVTVRQLMGHVAGVRNDGGDESPLYSQHCEHPAEAVRHFAESPLRFEPGTRSHFSSYGWILVSAAIEAAAGQPLRTFMRDQIFTPLGMRDTMAESAESIPDRVTFYFPRYSADPTYGLHLMRPLDYSCYSGAAAFLSTPSDLVRFGMAINNGTLLQRATVLQLQAPQPLPSGDDTGYGLGWDLETVTLAGEPTRVVGHNGATLGGMVASLITIPDDELVIAVMSNISYADTFAIGTKVAQAFMEQGRTAAPK